MTKRKNQVVNKNVFSLSFAWISGFVFTFAILVLSKIIGYEIITQQSYTGVSNNLLLALNFVKKSIQAPEIILSVMGGFLSFGLRYLFLFGKPYSV